MKMNEKQMQQIKAAAKAYVMTSAADWLAFGKPLKGVWTWGLFPMSEDVLAGLISSVEETDEGLKFRFRPSNAALYRVAARNAVTLAPLASAAAVDSLVVSIAADSGCRVNRGHAFEALTAAACGADWSLNPIQSGYWEVPDYVAADGRTIQCKAYGASIPESDLLAAIKAAKQA